MSQLTLLNWNNDKSLLDEKKVTPKPQKYSHEWQTGNACMTPAMMAEMPQRQPEMSTSSNHRAPRRSILLAKTNIDRNVNVNKQM